MADTTTSEDEVVSVPFDEQEVADSTRVYKTYRMDLEHKRVGGMIDGIEACMQAIWKILSTVRFANLIYDDQYGCDIFNKVNQTGLTDDYLQSDMPVMVEEALLYDERILEVTNFSYDILSGDSVHVNFTANTIYGDLEVEGVVTDGN